MNTTVKKHNPGNNPGHSLKGIVIPARFASQRLPGIYLASRC